MHDFILFCTGVIFTTSLIILISGYKYTATVCYSIFYFALFIYSLAIANTHNQSAYFQLVLEYFHYVLPALLLTASLIDYGASKRHFIYVLIMPVTGLTIHRMLYFTGLEQYINSFTVIYHTIAWTSVSSVYLRMKKKPARNSYYGIILIFIAQLPFIAVNGYMILQHSRVILLDMLPVSLALTSLVQMYLMYQENLLKLNYNYYTHIDFIKKSASNEKKTIIEKLSGSLIHEIKNPLTSIKSLLQQLYSGADTIKPEKTRHYINIMTEEIERIRLLADSYLVTIRKRSDFRENVHVPHELEAIRQMIHSQCVNAGCVVALRTQGSTEDLSITSNKMELRQIFLNLIYNGIEAQATRIDLHVYRDAELTVTVEDNGTGIEGHAGEKIFEPFYTTKLDGTGMGLAICRELLHEHSSDLILVQNANPTRFKVILRDTM